MKRRITGYITSADSDEVIAIIYGGRTIYSGEAYYFVVEGMTIEEDDEFYYFSSGTWFSINYASGNSVGKPYNTEFVPIRRKKAPPTKKSIKTLIDKLDL